jgi:hypothetical protein
MGNGTNGYRAHPRLYWVCRDLFGRIALLGFIKIFIEKGQAIQLRPHKPTLEYPYPSHTKVLPALLKQSLEQHQKSYFFPIVFLT